MITSLTGPLKVVSFRTAPSYVVAARKENTSPCRYFSGFRTGLDLRFVDPPFLSLCLSDQLSERRPRVVGAFRRLHCPGLYPCCNRATNQGREFQPQQLGTQTVRRGARSSDEELDDRRVRVVALLGPSRAVGSIS